MGGPRAAREWWPRGGVPRSFGRPAHAQALLCHAHARGRRATAYRLGATRALLRRGHWGRARPRRQPGRALRRPAALSSNGLGERVPWLHQWLHGSKEAASDLSETASDLLFPVGMTGFEPATP